MYLAASCCLTATEQGEPSEIEVCDLQAWRICIRPELCMGAPQSRPETLTSMRIHPVVLQYSFAGVREYACSVSLLRTPTPGYCWHETV